MEEIRQNKERKTFTLKPVNVTWLAKRAFELSTPEDKISDSALLDEILDQARQAESPTRTSKKNETARLETVAA
jgi:hypothetical protein